MQTGLEITRGRLSASVTAPAGRCLTDMRKLDEANAQQLAGTEMGILHLLYWPH